MNDSRRIGLAGATWQVIDGSLDNYIAVRLQLGDDNVQTAIAMRQLGWAAGYPGAERLRFSIADLDVETIREALRNSLTSSMRTGAPTRELEAALGALSRLP